MKKQQLSPVRLKGNRELMKKNDQRAERRTDLTAIERAYLFDSRNLLCLELRRWFGR